MVIDGKTLARGMVEDLKRRPKPEKFLAAVLVGADPASVGFLKQKEKIARELGVDFRLFEFPDTLPQDGLRGEVLKIARHGTCGGIIVQLPLPPQVGAQYVLNVIPREKDIEVLGERALGAFYAGRNPVLPPAAGVVERVVGSVGLPMRSSRVAVVGLGVLVGKPVATWLMGACAEFYLLAEGGDFGVLKRADVVVVGVGKPGLIEPGMLKDGALVIDFGYSQDANGKLRGDFDSSSLTPSSLAPGAYTPTPGGTGPILVAQLFENFFLLSGPKH